MLREILLNYSTNYFYTVLYLIALITIGGYELRKNIKNKTIFSGTNLFLFFYYVFIAIGPIYLIFTKEYQYNYNVLFLFVSCLVVFLFGSNFLIGNKKLVLSRQKKKNQVEKKVFDYNNVIKTASLFLCISYIAIFLYITKNINFIFQDFENNRVLAMQGNGVLLYFSYMMLPSIWMLYYCHLNYSKNKKIYIYICLSVFLLLFVGFRSRILELILLLIVIRNDYKPFKLKKLLKFGFGLLGLACVLQLARIYVSSGIKANSLDSFMNTFFVNSINMKYIFNTFPNKMPFQYGYTYWLGISILLPNNSLDATLWLKQVTNIQFNGGGLTPTIIGENFINFGYYGIYIGMLIYGCLFKIMDNRFGNSKNINKVIYYTFVFYMARSVSSGLSNWIITIIWFFVVEYVITKIKI